MTQAMPTRPLPQNFALFQNRPIKVLMIGAGGNGSEMLDGLMRIHQGLVALDAPGLHVHVFDGDDVEPSNVVRQRFWPHEIGLNKATALVHRANTLMGTRWMDYPKFVTAKHLEQAMPQIDLVITAVDSVVPRQQLVALTQDQHCPGPYADKPHPGALWCDMGCDRDQGQMVLGALAGNTMEAAIPNVAAHFPALLEAEDSDDTPSCGAAESLARQDLMINQQVAASATNLIWKTLRHAALPYNGAVIDLSSGLTQAIPFIGELETASVPS